MKALRIAFADPTLRAMLALVTLFGTLAASFAPYQSLIAIELFGMSDPVFAAVLTGAAIMAVIGAVGAGILTDQTGARREIALASAVLMVTGTLLVRAFPGQLSFAVAHVFILPIGGSLFGQIFAATRHACAAYPADERDAILAAVRALFALPFIVVLPIWGVVLDAGVSLLEIYAVIVVISAAMIWVIARHWPRDLPETRAAGRSGLGFRASLREIADGRVLLRVFLMGAISGGVFMYMVVLGLMFEVSPARDRGDVAIFAGLVAGLEVPIMLSMSSLLRLTTRMGAIAIGTALYAGFLIAFPLLVDGPFVWVLTIPAAVGGGIILSLPMAYLQDLLALRAGAGGSLLALQKVVGDGLGAALFALATWVAGYGLASVLGGVLMLVGCTTLIWLDRRAPMQTA